MTLTSTYRLTWVPVATLLATMAIGCEGRDGETSPRESEFARRTPAAGDAGVLAPTDEDAGDGEGPLDGAVASFDGGTSTASPDAGVAPTDEEVDAAVELTDNQIFGILAANNAAELSAVAAGEGKLLRPGTIAFARSVRLSADQAATRHAVLARLADLTAEDSEESIQRGHVAADLDTMLESEPPSDSLDLRYAFGEAMTNQLLVELIDNTFLSRADSELLKSELRTTRETARRRVTEGGAIVAALARSVQPSEEEPSIDTDDTDTGDAGTDDTGADDTSAGDAGTDHTGTDDAGTDHAGAGDAGTDEP